MELPPEIAEEVRRRVEHAHCHSPQHLSLDGKAIRVDGGPGYDCYISPEGDVYMETYDLLSEDDTVADRSRRAQLLVFALGARTLPELRSLMPRRPVGVADCVKCLGEGRFPHPKVELICGVCCGLGWLEDPGMPPIA
jgi:hypothetical protein